MRSVNSQRAKLAAIILSLFPLTSAYAIHYQGPLVVNDAYVKKHGRVIVGNFQGTINTPALTISTSYPVLITDSNFIGPGDLIYAAGASITVTNSTGTGTNPNVAGTQKGDFLHTESAISVNAMNNTVTGTRFGFYIHNYTGATSGVTINVSNNVINNIDARPSNGNGGYVTSGEWNGHAIQLNLVQSVPNITIAWNQVINTPFQSQCSDIINMFQSSGTSASPILIHDNYLQGAFPADPGPDHYSGGGIITDGTAKDTLATATAFVQMFNNQVVATANYGLSIASGHDNSIYNNRVVSSGFTTNGAFYAMPFGNGLNNYNNYGQPANILFNNIAYNNVSGLIRKNSAGALMRSDWYLPSQTTNTNVNYQPNNTATPTPADESAEFTSWLSKLVANHITIGVSS
jgi:hypothetical protein